MKKYIALAALLGAGPVLNAADFSESDTQLTLSNAVGYGWVEDGVLKTSNFDTSGDILSGYSFTLGENEQIFATSNGNRRDGTIILTFDASKLSAPEALDSFVSFSSGWGLGYTADNTFCGLWYSSANGLYNYGPNTANIDGYETEEGVLQVAITAGDSGTRIFLKNGSTYWSNTNLKGSFGSTELTLSSLASGALLGFAVWDVDMYVDSSAAKSAVTEGMNVVASIPEPSAFGLLAGVGALAFVASRRRRK